MTAVSETASPSGAVDRVRRIGAGRAFPYLVAIPLTLVLWGYVVQPMIATVVESAEGSSGLGVYLRYLTGEGVARDALLTSLLISLVSVVTCALVGVSMAFLLARFDFPGRRLIESVILVPAALPPLIGAVSFVLLYSDSGIVPRGLQQLLHADHPVFAVEGVAGVLVVHTFTMYPFFYLATSAALAGLDPSLEEAAYNLGARRLRVWRTVLLPMLTPALVSGALLVFMVSMASYTAPLLFGVNEVMTMQIYQARTSGDLALSSAHSTVLALVSVAFLLLMRWYEGRRAYRSLSKGVGQARREIGGRMGRWIAFTVACLGAFVLVAPALTILLVSFGVDGTWTTQVLPPEYTVENYRALFADLDAFRPIWNSVRMSGVGTLACLVVGVAAAYALSRLRFVGRRLLDVAIMLPWALPGTVIGVNLIVAFSTASPYSAGKVLLGTFWILPLAYFVRFMPLVFRSSMASFGQLDPSLEEAARNLGAGWLTSFRTVTLRLIWRGVLAGTLLAFVHGVGEFVASVLIYTSATTPISVAIYNEMYRADFGSAAAYGSLQVLLIFIVMVGTRRLEGRRPDTQEAARWAP